MESSVHLASRRSRWRLELLPGRGGAWLKAEARDAGGVWRSVLRPTAEPALAQDQRLRYANYALLPYSNRVADGGILAHRGQPQAAPMPRNWPGITHPIHGVGWLQAWTPRRLRPRELALSLHWTAAPGWPWHFEAKQRLRLLGEDILQLDLSLRNLDRREMPAGLGWHPGFDRRSQLQLRLKLQARQLVDADGLPRGMSQVVGAPRAGQLMPAEQLCGIDSAFAGWSGRARLRWPEFGVDLRATGALSRHLVVYAPSADDVLCLEPVSHLSNALGQTPPIAARWGQRWLAPGEELHASVRLRLLK